MGETAEEQRIRRANRIAAGLCTRCGKLLPKEWARQQCQVCNAKKIAYYHDVWRERLVRGACKHCEKQRRPGKQTCEEHALNQSQWQMDMRERRFQQGLCVQCGKAKPLPSMSEVHKKPLCETCLLKNLARFTLGAGSHWKMLRDKLEAQDYRCPYTGVRLHLGYNASIDHIMPKARYPDLAHDPSNLEWVASEVNVMKRDMLREEFLPLCAQIVRFTGARADDFSETKLLEMADRPGNLWPSDAVKGMSFHEKMRRAAERRTRRVKPKAE